MLGALPTLGYVVNVGRDRNVKECERWRGKEINREYNPTQEVSAQKWQERGATRDKIK